MDMGNLGWIVTVVVFGAVGWRIASRRSRPAGFLAFGGLFALAVVGHFLGTGARFVDIDEFKVPVNLAVVAGCVGGGLRLFVRNRQLRRPAAG